MEEAAIREAYEETGCIVEKVRPNLVFIARERFLKANGSERDA